MASGNKRVRANEQIRVPQIRLIGSKGEQIGIISSKDALQRARDEGLDLVEVAGNVNPPVCRILDLGKYIYSLSKKEKEAKKKQKVIAVKEVKMTFKIDDHDYQTKLRNSRKFIERGDKVKLTMFFRGREITHVDLGRKLIARFIEDISDVAEVERNEGLEGNAIHMYFTPKGTIKKPDAPAAAETRTAPSVKRPDAPPAAPGVKPPSSK